MSETVIAAPPPAAVPPSPPPPAPSADSPVGVVLPTIAQEAPQAVIPTIVALRFAALAAGILLMFGNVLMVKDPLFGICASLLSAAFIAGGVLGTRTWFMRRPTAHILASILSLLVYVHWCASACGSFETYATVLWIPTGLWGIVMHAGIAATVLLVDRKPNNRHAWLADAAIGLGIGSSIFFGAILAQHGSYCGGCIAIHSLMLIQLIEGVVHLSLPRLAMLVGWMVASAGLANAVFHHARPERLNDPGALVSYLRSSWEHGEVARFRQGNVNEASDKERQELLDKLLAVPEEPVPQRKAPPGPAAVRPVRPAQAKPEPVAAARIEGKDGQLRPIAQANRVGRDDAPVLMTMYLSAGCPHCAEQIMQLATTLDLVESGKVAIRVHIKASTSIQSAMATITYAAGLKGPQALLDTLLAMFANQSRIQVVEDALDHLPESFPRTDALHIITSNQDALSDLLTDAQEAHRLGGIAADPTLIFENRRNGLRRILQGSQVGEAIRLAVETIK